MLWLKGSSWVSATCVSAGQTVANPRGFTVSYELCLPNCHFLKHRANIMNADMDGPSAAYRGECWEECGMCFGWYLISGVLCRHTFIRWEKNYVRHPNQQPLHPVEVAKRRKPGRPRQGTSKKQEKQARMRAGKVRQDALRKQRKRHTSKYLALAENISPFKKNKIKTKGVTLF